MEARRWLVLAGWLAVGCSDGPPPPGIDLYLYDARADEHVRVELDLDPSNALVAADFDGDGTAEIISMQEDRTVAVRADGSIVPLLDSGASWAAWLPGTDGAPEVLLALVVEDYVSSLIQAQCELASAGCEVIATRELEGYPATFVVGDVDGDGILDLMTWGDREVRLLRGQASAGPARAWGPEENYVGADGTEDAPFEFSRPIALGDLDGDGALDLAVGELEDGIKVFFGSGDGETERALLLPSEPVTEIVIADVTGDGLPDLVSDGFETEIFRQIDAETFERSFHQEELFLAHPMIGDLDDRPGRDLLVLDGHFPKLARWVDQGWELEHLEVSKPMRFRGMPGAAVTADFDGDGRDDFAIARPRIFLPD